MTSRIEVGEEKMNRFRGRYGIQCLARRGSVLRSNFREDIDVDLNIDILSSMETLSASWDSELGGYGG